MLTWTAPKSPTTLYCSPNPIIIETRHMSQAHIKQLDKHFNDILHGRVAVDPRNFRHFLEGLRIQEDPSMCVNSLISNCQLLSVQYAMRYDLSLSFINGLAADTLEYLLRTANTTEGLLDHILIAIVEPPIFWSRFAREFEAGTLTDNAQLVFAKVLDRLIALKDEDTSPYRDLAIKPSIHHRLHESPQREIKEISHHISHVLAAFTSSGAPTGTSSPGERHDNDFANFRDISILPTANEILTTQLPFIHPPSPLDGLEASCTRVADYIDNTFRMLREDMVHDTREKLQITQRKKPGQHRGLRIHSLIMAGVYTGSSERGSRWGLVLRCHHDFPQLRGLDDFDDRKRFLSEDAIGLKILESQSLVCLIADNDVVSFATVLRVEELLAEKPPSIVLQLEGEASTSKTLLRLSAATRVQLLQIDTAPSPSVPVLQALRSMQFSPLLEELLFWKEGQIIGPLSSQADQVVEPLSRNPSIDLHSVLSISKSVQLDKSQAESLLSGLKQRVALIQGPPGTGKSFIGALLVKSIRECTTQTILVVCCTNHALDQFLRDLIDTGIDDSSIVRMGGGASASVEHLTLLSKERTKLPLSRAEWTFIEQAKSTSGFLVERLRKAFEDLTNADRVITFDAILRYIQFEDSGFWSAFQVPPAAEGAQITPRNRKPIHQDYLLRQWARGLNAGIFEGHATVRAAEKIWNMDVPLRQARLNKWREEIRKTLVMDVCNVGRDYNHSQDELAHSFRDSTVALLKQMRIIGCTATGAAKYAEELAAVGPDVILVEEAGEILESYILTALGAKTSQMILIGDYEQPQPKVNNCSPTAQKEEGPNPNVSFFERLVLKGFPRQTLTTQYRMRPEISAFIRELTYPELIDHPSTRNRPNIRGIQSNIIFVNHTHPEDEESRIADRKDRVSAPSKQNTYEAEMVLKIVQYLKRQGYKNSDMVVLTPYLGQLFRLHQVLRNEHKLVLGDLDTDVLQCGGLLDSTMQVASEAHQLGIRLATIDNYWGEESRIVIASLTRSNPENSIGFMASPERLGALISRARDGLILIGNSHTFLKSKEGAKHWERFFSLLNNGMCVYEGFPIKCEMHPSQTMTLARPEEFDYRSPDGGCAEPCGVLLKCQLHPCPKKCHPLELGPNQPDVHSSMLCKHICQDNCPAGVHTISWKCHQGRPTVCPTCDRLNESLKKRASMDTKAKEERDEAQYEHDIKMAELAAELRYQQEALDDIQKKKDRENEIRKKEKEVEDAKKKIRAEEDALKKAVARAKATGQTLSRSSSLSGLDAGGLPTPRPKFPSAARDRWEDQKRVDAVQNDVLDKIMDITGLEQVKEQILRIKGSLDTMHRQGIPINLERLNLALLGNPGTGKTTVARLYAQFLESIQVLPGNAFRETTGSKLSSDGIRGAQKLIDNALAAGGGAIFIDEAYQLVSEYDQSGKQVLDFLLAEMENRVGTLVFIIAGYSKQMEKFFEHNPGVPSRVPYQLTFADYTDKELLSMLEDLIYTRYKGQMKVEGGTDGLYVRIAIRRLGRGRGRPGFGNARALQNMFAKIRERQAERIDSERRSGLPEVDDFLLTKEDLIGPDPSKVLPNSVPWAKLQGLIGLESVKDTVRNFFVLLETNYQRELAEKEPMQFSLNRVFLGSPGTGKTTVAKLYGQILADLGTLSNGEVVTKNPADFLGAHLGHSEKNTKSIIESTVGKVLVIDEAYMLYNKSATDSYKTSVIDTLVSEIQGVPGEDRCVLLLGYKDQMEEMFQNVNPGLGRRFSIESAFIFENFTVPQLMTILEYKLKDRDLSATDDAKATARDLLSQMKNRPNFGNAGDVENMLGQAMVRYQKRTASAPASKRMHVVFKPEDIDPNFDRSQYASTNLAKMFSDIVGCEEVIKKFGDYQKIAKTMKEKGLDMRTRIPSNFVFKGPPGSGKTTTARKLGQVYYDMGFLSSKDVIECSPTDLVGQYVGHTGPKTKSVFEKAIGKVLFIDEAYRLSDGHFAKEAMDEIVGLMTHERYMNKLVIILAGYEHQMNGLLAVNPGLSSRFSEEVIFQNMSSEQCLELLDKELKKDQIVVPELCDKTSLAYIEMQDAINQMSALPSWGNGRDVKTLAKRLVQKAFAIMASGGTADALSAEETLGHVKSMLKEQLDRQNIAHISHTYHGSMPMASMYDTAPPPPTMSTSTSQAVKRAPPPPPPSVSQENIQTKQSAEQTPAVIPEDELLSVASRAVLKQPQADSRAQQQTKKAAKKASRLAQRAGGAAQRRAKELKQAMATVKDGVKKRVEHGLQEAYRRAVKDRVANKKKPIGRCSAGYEWVRESGGYRCTGGSHFIADR